MFNKGDVLVEGRKGREENVTEAFLTFKNLYTFTVRRSFARGERNRTTTSTQGETRKHLQEANQLHVTQPWTSSQVLLRERNVTEVWHLKCTRGQEQRRDKTASTKGRPGRCHAVFPSLNVTEPRTSSDVLLQDWERRHEQGHFAPEYRTKTWAARETRDKRASKEGRPLLASPPLN